MKKLFYAFTFLCFSLNLIAQEAKDTTKSKEEVNYYDMDLEALMNVEVTVASKKALTLRESPGIISVITEEEIQSCGARDLIDVLRLVPGFEFGVDVESVIGVGTRGIWGHEGKILLLIDGQEMNELMYGTLILGNHYPVDIIKKIEIIRGPGSAMYGGSAELAVVNIITKSASDINGVSASILYGQLDKAMGRANVTLNAGKEFSNGLALKLNTMYGNGIRSTKIAKDLYGSSYDMKNSSNVNPFLIDLGLKYKGLSIVFLGDMYKTTQKDVFGGYMTSDQKAIPTDFLSYLGEIKYDIKVNDKFTVTPKYNFKQFNSYYVTQEQINPYLDTNNINYFESAAYLYDRTVQRQNINLTSMWDIAENINLVSGVDYYMDNATSGNDRSKYMKDTTFVKTLTYSNIAAFAQGVIKTKIANITLGARYENHSQAGNAFVPRIGLTKAWDKFHIKALYTQAFRSPNIANLSLNNSINPEKTNVIEIEAGYKLTTNLFITANVFDITIKDPIIYYVDSIGEHYGNFKNTGTNGFEFELKFLKNSFFANLNYSYYTAKDKNKVDLYAVSPNNAQTLAFPASKICLNAGYRSKKITINPTLIYLSERYAYADPSLSTPVKLESVVLFNLFVNFNNVFKGLSIGVGAYDIANSKYEFIQPYNGGHAPLPAGGREFIVKLSYNLNTK